MKNGTVTVKIVVSWLVILLSGCMNGPGFLNQSNESNQKDKNVEVDAKAAEDIEGAVIGEFKATSQATQVLSADQDSAVQGATISIAPNSLAIDTSITIQEGAAIASDAVVQQVVGDGSLGIASSTNAVHVSSGQTIDLAQPMTVQLTIPDSASLTTNDLSTLVVFYKVFKKSEGIWVHGFLAREKLAVENSVVSFEIQHFGAFQVAFLTSTPTESVKEVPSASSAISKKEEKSLPTVAWAAHSASFNAAARSVSVAIQATGLQELDFCEVFADSDLVLPFDLRQNTGNALSATLLIKSPQAMSLAFKWSCIEKNGRLSESGWSDKLAIPKEEIKLNQQPLISLTNPSALNQPAALNGSYSINFTASDADDVAKIGLYYKANAQGCSAGLTGWSKIVDDLKEGTHTSHNWSLSALAPGAYFICAHINDGRGGEAYTVSAGSVKVMAAPTVQLTTTHSNPTNATLLTFTATFSHDVSGFDTNDVTVVNGTKSGFAAVDAKTYTINVVPTGGAVNISIPAGVATDAAGSGNVSASASITYDGSAPTVAITSPQSDPTNATIINITVQFSEPVSGFSLSDITVSGGSKSNFAAVDEDTYTFGVTSPTGPVTVDIAAGAATDAAGNDSLAASQFSLTYDGTAPTVALSSGQTSPTNAATINMTVQFSENVTGFTLADITVNNGTKDNFVAVDGDTYTFDIISPSGTVTVDVAANVAQDAALNGNTAATQFSIIHDSGQPTVALTAAQTSPTNSTTINMTAQFSEPVTGFDVSDINVANGSAGNFAAVDGDTYTFDITAPTGTVTVDIAANAAVDSGGNGSQAATQFTIDYDGTNPTVTITAAQTSPTNASTINVTVQFSEAVTGFNSGDITVGNGTLDNFDEVDGDTYTFDIISPTGTVTVDVASSVANDPAGNANDAATQLSIIYDSVVPTVGLSATQSSPTSAATINMTVQFSEAVINFDVTDITVTGGTKGNFIAVDGDTYTFDITAPSGTVTVDVAASVSQDLAGNNNSAATQFTIVHDSTNPTVTLSSGSGTLTNLSTITLTALFSEAVTDFAVGDISLSSGSVASFSGSGNTYSFTVNLVASVVTIDIAAGVTHDAAGNGNLAASQLSITYDNTAPGVTLSATQSSPTNAATINMTAEFTEPVTGFTIGDIVVGGGTLGNFNISNSSTYTFDITPTGANISVDIASGVAQDAATNNNTAAVQYTITYDNSAPTLTLNAAQSSPTDSTVITMTAIFSEPVTGFDLTDVIVTGGTKGSFNEVNPTQYTFTVTALTSDVTVNVAAGVATDAATNGNTAATQFSMVTTATLANPGLLEFMRGTAVTTPPFSKTGSNVSSCVSDVPLPAGLSINATVGTCQITGMPSQLVARKSYPITVTAASGASSTSEIEIVVRDLATIPVKSPKRVSFYDTVTGKHWAFYRYNSEIRIINSSDGVHWADVTNPLITAGDDFAVAAKSGRVVVAVKNGPSINLSRFVLETSSVTIINAQSTPLSGTGSMDDWSQPAVVVGHDNLIYLAAYHTIGDGTRKVPKLVVSSNAFDQSTVGFGAPMPFGVPVPTPQGIALAPYSDATFKVIAAVKGHQDQLRTFLLNSTTAVEKKGSGSEWWGFTGPNAINGAVRAMAVLGNDLYVGGQFTDINGDPSKAYLARWDGVAWHAVSGRPNGSVYALAVIGNSLYVGGSFTTPGNNIAKLDNNNWYTLGAGAESEVRAFAVDGSTLFVGGSFTNVAGSTQVNGVAKWESGSWTGLGAGVDNNHVFAMTMHNGSLYIGGTFTSVASVAGTDKIAKWSGSNWLPVGSGIPNAEEVNALASYGGELIVGGRFDNIGAVSDAANIARWNGSTWAGLGSGMADRVRTLVVHGPHLYAGGNFTAPGNHVARWDGSIWTTLLSGASSLVWDLAVFQDQIYVGGNFTTAGGVTASNLARYSPEFVANTKSFSLASHGSAATLAFIKATDGKPYSLSLNGSTWTGLHNLIPEANPTAQIQIAASADGTKLLAAWGSSDGKIKYRAFDTTWGTPQILSTIPASSVIPWLPSQLSDAAPEVPVLWHVDSAPEKLEIGIVEF